MSLFNPCFLIPCYNHGRALSMVIENLQRLYNYPIIIVDDGSDLATKESINKLQESCSIVTLASNQGKGGAVYAGIQKAHASGYSHAIQIDADGQHDLKALPQLIQESKDHPNALISGRPIYDKSVPKGRLYGRYITHFWVWIETLSFSIKDSMCGFRSYPVSASAKLLSETNFGLRMDFDTEIMVKLYWADCDVRFIDTRVIYPEDGISHFNAFKDNLLISKMHTKLFFSMLPRIPKLLKRKQRLNLQSEKHWSKQDERGTYYGIKLLLLTYSLLGRTAFKIALAPILFYYSLTAKSTKAASQLYLNRLQQYALQTDVQLPSNLSVYQHINSFAVTMLDKLAAWKGDFSMDDLTIHGESYIEQVKASGKGIVILGSHLGNLELCRALSKRHQNIKINALVFVEHAPRFNAVMKAVNPNSELNIIQVDKLGPDTAILLDQKIEAGEWVVIVGDRTSTSIEQRAVWTDFLGHSAPFPQGPFLLASILKAPVYTLFGLRDETKKQAHFNIYFEPFCEQIKLPRGQREEGLQAVVQQYAQRLQFYTMKNPLQWYNFFNFWQLSGKSDDR